MIPSVFLAGAILTGLGVALVTASQHSRVPIGFVAGLGCLAFGVLFIIGSVIA